MPTTTYLGLTYPALSNAPNVPQDMQTLAGNVDTKLGGVIICTSAARPTARNGAVIYETDTGRLAKYTGSAWEYVAGSRTSFTPTLTAATTSPTMGTGAIRNSWYCYLPGPSIYYDFFISFGTSGAAAGSGGYSISLPVTSASVFGTGHPAVGTGLLADASTGAFQSVSLFISNASTTLGIVGSAPVTSVSPWTWANSDYLSGSIIYPI